MFNRRLVAALAALLSVQAYGLDESAAIKVTPILQTSTTWEGRPIVYPTGPAQVTGLMIEIAPGGETGWHAHPVPSFGVVLEGILAVTLKDGRVKTIHAGEPVAEVVDTLHNGRNVGDTPVKLIVFYTGTTNQALTTRP